MQIGQKLLPQGIDLDTSFLYLKSDKAFFLKGVESTWMNVDGKGNNALEIKPSESNYLYCSVPLPIGVNTVIGYYYFAEENTGYVIVFNSEGYHFIYRLRGYDGQCEIVYRFCRNFPGITNKPRDFFSEGRIAIKSLCRYKPDGTKELYKELYLVNKKVDNLRIVVEDSIATNSFTTSFFTPKDTCCGDPCRIIKSGVPTPMAKINIVPIQPTDTDKLKQNLLLFQMFQFRFVDENAWGQRSEHGLISDQYFNNLAGCSRDANGQPHCVWLETKTPCPEIVRRTVEVRSCQIKNATGTDGNLFSEWKEAFHIDLYDKTDANLNWYERKYDKANTEFEFFNDDKNIRIRFCNNRECKPIALADIRSQNPAPINSGTVASIGRALGYGDNENDLGPILKEDLDKIKLSLTPSVPCDIKYSRIKVYAVVHNIDDNQNNPVFTRTLVTFGGFGQDPLIGGTRFEEKVGDPETPLNAKGGHGQYFPKGVNGFRGRLAGTNFTAESVQYVWNPTGIEKIGVAPYNNGLKVFIGDNSSGFRWFIQEFDFGLVPCGTYRFRINGHNDTDNLENTSTYYLHTGTVGEYQHNYDIPQNYRKEIFINTTAGNDFVYNGSDTPLAVIADLTHPQNTISIGSRVLRGYIYEGRDNKIPMEMVEVKVNNNFPTGGVSSGFTDHNGFYFTAEWTHGSAFSRTDYKAQLFGSSNCVFNQFFGETGNKTAEGTTLVQDMYVADKITDYDKMPSNRYVITGRISECVQGGGIEGVAVVLSKTKPAYTNTKGEFKIIAHYSNGRTPDNVIISLGGSCYILDCNCQPINVIINANQPLCASGVQKEIPIGAFSLKTIVTKGFPHGSRIQVGFIGVDFLGRSTAIETTENMYIDFPSEPEQKSATYPQLIVTLPAKFSSDICKRFKYLIPAYSKNVNFDDFFSWAADDVTLIDSAGEKNESNPSKIKIWWRSLNGYNILRGGNTNTNWSFLNAVIDSKGSQLLIGDQAVLNARVGDVVEFIQNVDGTYFPPNTTGNVQYDREGTYFLVDYDDSLKDVKAGTKFRIKRPYVCETNKTFYEFCYPINFCSNDCAPRNDDGEIITSFVLNGYSSYMLPRQIPVVQDIETVTETTAGSSASALKNIIVTPIVNKLFGWNQDTKYTIKETETTEVTKTVIYPFAFEHHSPSDTWGDHCNNGGRVSYINPYERKKCDRTQILITGGLNQENDGVINYLHYFKLEDDYVLDEDGFGAIIALLVRNDQQVLVICNFRTFAFRFNENRVVVTEQGYLSVPTNKRFSKPETNPFFEFGCQPNDINTIRRADSIVVFLDSHKQEMVQHDFTNAAPISMGIQSWLVPAIKEVSSKSDYKYWHTCFDFRLKKLFLTKFDLTTNQFGNSEIEDNILLSETMAFNYETRQWNQVHFTPEYFGSMYSDRKDSQFFSFKNGIPYAHHNAVNPGPVYLNYFGVQYFPVIGVVTNEGASQEKGFISTEVYCRELRFILEEVKTSLGQLSHSYEGQWTDIFNGMSSAPYLCDLNNPDECNTEIQDLLYDGTPLIGKWLTGLYIPEPEYDGRFFLLGLIVSNYFNRSNG